jgi:hypothetical protein
VVGAQAEGEPDWLVFSRAAWREFQACEQRIRQLRAEESSWPDAPGAVTFDTLRAQERAPGLDETEREYLGAAWEDHELVFCTQRGRPLSARNLYRRFKQLLRQGALPTFESMIFATRRRHSFLQGR